jgi:hypothetical protein
MIDQDGGAEAQGWPMPAGDRWVCNPRGGPGILAAANDRLQSPDHPSQGPSLIHPGFEWTVRVPKVSVQW